MARSLRRSKKCNTRRSTPAFSGVAGARQDMTIGATRPVQDRHLEDLEIHNDIRIKDLAIMLSLSRTASTRFFEVGRTSTSRTTSW
jgi:hypothetical protein